jgi:hypothetical protein
MTLNINGVLETYIIGLEPSVWKFIRNGHVSPSGELQEFIYKVPKMMTILISPCCCLLVLSFFCFSFSVIFFCFLFPPPPPPPVLLCF